MSAKVLKGEVVSAKMAGVVVVKVEMVKTHKRYKKRYISHTRLMAQNSFQNVTLGDSVVIVETAPKSKGKKWFVKEKISKL